MNKLDIFIVIVICLATSLGIWKGLIRQLVVVAGVIIGYAVSIRSYERVAGMFPSVSPDTAKLAGFIGMFVLCILGALSIGWFAGKVLKEAGIGWLNRIAGGALGFLKGFFVVAVVVMVLVSFLPSDNVLIKNSVTVPAVISGIKLIGSFVPDNLWASYKKKLDMLQSEKIRNIIEKGVRQ